MTTDQYRQFRSFLFIVAPLLLFVIFLSPGVVAAKSLTPGSWKIVASPSASGSYFNGVAAFSTCNVWAVGDVGGNNGQVSTLIEHWNGTRWSVVPSPSTSAIENILNSVVAISATNVWAVGYTNDGTGLFQTLIEHWNGKKWSIVSSPNASSSSILFAVARVPKTQKMWTVGSNNGFQTFTEFYTP